MRIDQWHTKKLAADPEYADAVKYVRLSEDLADLVVRLRLRRGLSQVELAQRANATQAMISRLENGEGNPTVDVISRVMVALLDANLVATQPPSASATPAAGYAGFRNITWEPVSSPDFATGLDEPALAAA